MRAAIRLQGPRNLGRTVPEKSMRPHMWRMPRYRFAKLQSKPCMMTVGIFVPGASDGDSAGVAGSGLRERGVCRGTPMVGQDVERAPGRRRRASDIIAMEGADQALTRGRGGGGPPGVTPRARVARELCAGGEVA
jgi:hypothetical protein